MCVKAGGGERLPTAKLVKSFQDLFDVSEFEQASSIRVTLIYSENTDTQGLLVESSVKLKPWPNYRTKLDPTFQLCSIQRCLTVWPPMLDDVCPTIFARSNVG